MDIPKLTTIFLASLQGTSGSSRTDVPEGGADVQGVTRLDLELVEAFGGAPAPGPPTGSPLPPTTLSAPQPLAQEELHGFNRWLQETGPAILDEGIRTDQVRGYLERVFRPR